MRRDEALRQAIKILGRSGTDSPALDAEVLLSHSLKISKEELLTHPERKLTSAQERRFFSLIRRRAKREPVAYITGHKEFYDLDFLVNRRTLIPRPETETLVEAVLERTEKREKRKELTLIDIGTGSGAIIISLVKKLHPTPHTLHPFATDISSVALRVARANAHRHGVKVKFIKANLLLSSRGAERRGDLIRGLPRDFRPSQPSGLLRRPNSIRTPRNDSLIITANLPYLPTREWRATEPEIKKYEPRSALDGGPDGLKYYRELFSQLKKLLTTDYLPMSEQSGKAKALTFSSEAGRQRAKRSYCLLTTLFIEFDPEQTTALKKLVHAVFPKAKIEIQKDLAHRNRVLIAKI